MTKNGLTLVYCGCLTGVIEIKFDFTCLNSLANSVPLMKLIKGVVGGGSHAHVCAAAEVVQKQEHGAWMWGSRRGARR